MSRKDFIIFAIIFAEGFIVLASEVLIMRRLIPYVGNSVDVTSVIIGLVLLPLAAGYFLGGKYQDKNNNIREKICKNFLIVGICLAIGFSFFTLELFFGIFHLLNINRIIQVSIYMMIFFVYPVYLLAQTVPLISNYFTKQNFTSLAGKILFSSTFGSLLGSIITTLVIMNFFGVSYSVLIVLLMVLIVSITLNKKLYDYNNLTILIFLAIYFTMDIGFKKEHSIYGDKLYSTVQILPRDEGQSKILKINNPNSSNISSAKITSDPDKRYSYVKHIEDNVIDIKAKRDHAQDILIIGAGGFTIGHEDRFNRYHFVDIDKDLKPISEKSFLEQKLPNNHKFIHDSARSFLKSTKIKYDLILLDVYSNEYIIPFQLLTVEFFQQIKDSLKRGGVAMLNIITWPDYADKYSIRVDNTLRTVFPNITRQIVSEYSYQKSIKSNILYIYKNIDYDNKIYTDNLNSAYLDVKN